MRAVAVARLDDLPPGQPHLVSVDGTRIVLTRVGAAVFACADACAHQGGPLSGGKQSGVRLACPWHGWMYDVRSGQCTFPGRGAAVATYSVRVDNGDVIGRCEVSRGRAAPPRGRRAERSARWVRERVPAER